MDRLAQALRAAVDYREVTPLEVADRMGVSRATVYRWLRGAHSVSLADAARLAEVLDVPGELLVRPPESRREAVMMMADWDGRSSATGPEPAAEDPDDAEAVRRLAASTRSPRQGSRQRGGTGSR